MDQSKRKLLALNAAKARLLAVQMVHDAASGHPGGSLSCLDALTTLYFDIMHVDPANPRDPDRDRFVMSKGHCSPRPLPCAGAQGLLPRGGSQDVPPGGRPYVRPRGNAPCEGRGYVHRLPGSGHLRRRGHGLGRKASKEGLPRLRHPGRRRNRRGSGVGGLHVRCQISGSTTSVPPSTSTACRSTARLPTSCPPSPWTRSSRPSTGTSFK